MRSWDQSHFDELCWHDVHVHGISIRAGMHGAGELVLDIDYIAEWLCRPDGTARFRVAPATLTFHDVYDLVMDLDYAKAQAAIVPFSIDGIEREPHIQANVGFQWRIPVNWPTGSISFTASGFTQVLRSEPIEAHEMILDPSQRLP
jgi:hypothetical protein